ncbi:16S rRNA (guanine(527)-N(7))-methyltransferase RsmG [Nitrosomonas supralitoralis]|uniref:Ribosomal RNA small subunit methyltransferase G n=1 Tax=Nitrosomonas supralitoralis TaxID=2116706 RepID=A0A2P7NW57_9PROT|nr:16S rRNA (guanine(527)-N(7))-methyltransferase RsmG [Nitrosomonas supralitoralis]PSJ17693.1 16S rRNA (guanine(527)-N(7))-methyltransferase RsmG [Nitrosomonas supralitoralis]
MSLLPQITQSLHALNTTVIAPGELLVRSIERYLLLIEKWNKVHNLTAIRKPQDMLIQHVMDSLVVLPHIHGPNIIDVGTGAGLPGIPIALAKPDWHVTLVESNQKKIAFLQQVKIELGLQNVEIVAQRIESVPVSRCVNTIISRAFSELSEFIALTRQWANTPNTDCRWVAMKGLCSEQERKQIRVPFLIENIVTLNVPELKATRQLIIIKHDFNSVSSD